jgi:hypothetical protein
MADASVHFPKSPSIVPRSDDAKIKLFLYAVKYVQPLYRPNSYICLLPPSLLSERHPGLALGPKSFCVEFSAPHEWWTAPAGAPRSANVTDYPFRTSGHRCHMRKRSLTSTPGFLSRSSQHFQVDAIVQNTRFRSDWINPSLLGTDLC